jgi:hypothetical protein
MIAAVLDHEVLIRAVTSEVDSPHQSFSLCLQEVARFVEFRSQFALLLLVPAVVRQRFEQALSSLAFVPLELGNATETVFKIAKVSAS